MRDAIVYSLLTWETFNVSERIALALVRLGARVLYCEHPASIFRRSQPRQREIRDGIIAFQPACLADRLNRVPFLGSFQTRVLAAQILKQTAILRLRAPLFFYHWLDSHLSLLRHLRRKFTFVHIQMDYGDSDLEQHERLSDITLTIPRSVYHQQRGRFGEAIKLIPQVVDLEHFGSAEAKPSPLLSKIPRPRLGYLGPGLHRLSKTILADVLRKHSDWHFISVDRERLLPLPNAHAVPWQSGRDLS